MSYQPLRPNVGAPAGALAGLLTPLHDRWFRLVHERLAPLLTPDTEFWVRWPAVRFLRDQFEDWCDHERQLVQSLAPHLRPAELRRLEQSAAALDTLRQQLDLLGCHRTDGKTADVARRFLASLELWRTEVEAALAGLTPDQLTDEGRRLFGHLETLAEPAG